LPVIIKVNNVQHQATQCSVIQNGSQDIVLDANILTSNCVAMFTDEVRIK